MNLKQLKENAAQLSDAEKTELIQFLKSNLPIPKSFSIRRAIAHAKSLVNLPNLKIKAYRKDAMQQNKQYGGAVDFEMALHLAIESYLKDGQESESPFWLIKEVPDDYGLNYENNTDENITKVVHSFLNDGHSTLELITSESRFPPENGEKINDNWIFLLQAKKFSAAMHWAIVSRDGKKVYNYGYG